MARRAAPLLALGAILLVTLAWWALALWPLPSEAPAWMSRTRALCFGATSNGLPDAEGWIALVLQPTLMFGTLFVVWGDAVAQGLRRMGRARPGRVALFVTAFALLAASAAAAARVHAALDVQASSSLSLGADVPPSSYPRLDRPAPELGLVDQRGATVGLADLRGRPALVTFAYAHCETVCPLVVSEALRARNRLGDLAPELVVVTLDPWRDTPARLAHIAGAWGIADGHVLSGSVERVNAVLDAWDVVRRRDGSTGEITHPALVYILDGEGTIAYAVRGGADEIVALTRRLPR